MNERFYSLDVFRGATVCFMILVNNAGSDQVYLPLEHAPWHGCTPTDLVFPFFLFAVGNALAFVMPKLEAAGERTLLTKVFKRSLLIFGIGLFLNWFPFVAWQDNALVLRHWVNPADPSRGVRILGVLQRISLCYLFASLIIHFAGTRGAFVLSGILLLGYWMLCLLLGTPGDPYSLAGYFGTNVDKAILHVPHMYKGEHVPFDPEGIMSTLPAITQVIFGYFVGQYILAKGKTYEMLSRIFVAGCVLAFAGYCWDMLFPINKKIWTSSFVLYTSGLAMMVLAVLIDLVEFRSWRGKWTSFFTAFGKNPLFVFVLSGLLPRTLHLIRWTTGIDEQGKPKYTDPLGWLYEHVCKPISIDERNGSLLYALILVFTYWVIAWWMDKRKIYVRV